MMRRKAQGALEEQPSRQIVFNRRKRLLLKKAMELSVLCDCDVALVLFGPDGRLVQYSSAPMATLLEAYAEACQKPHERFTNAELLREYHEEFGRHDDASGLALSRKRQLEMDGGAAAVVGPSGTGVDLGVSGVGPTAVPVEGLKPAGFMDDKNYPVSPRSEKAYKDITAQLDRWIEGNHRPLQEAGGHDSAAGAGPLSPGAGKRFKSLSIMVPENPSQHIRAPNGAGTGQQGAPVSNQPSTSAAGDAAGLDGLLRQHSQSISGGIMGLPSPSHLLFGLPSSGGLFTSRGGLNLDLPMPDSTTALGHALDWPTTSRGGSMLPGFSDDNESGEELPGDLMVTGRGIKSMGGFGGGADGPEVMSVSGRGHDGTAGNGGEAAAGPGPGSGLSDMDGLLMVSGIKVALPAGSGQAGKDGALDGGGGEDGGGGGGFEFPGFASSKEAVKETPMASQGKTAGGHSGNNGLGVDPIDIPLDL